MGGQLWTLQSHPVLNLKPGRFVTSLGKTKPEMAWRPSPKGCTKKGQGCSPHAPHRAVGDGQTAVLHAALPLLPHFADPEKEEEEE